MNNLLNVASWDRILRVGLGLVVLAAGFGVVGGTWGAVIGLVGLILVVTGFAGFCPLYWVFKFRSLKKRLIR